jgi:hypothetical protein
VTLVFCTHTLNAFQHHETQQSLTRKVALPRYGVFVDTGGDSELNSETMTQFPSFAFQILALRPFILMELEIRIWKSGLNRDDDLDLLERPEWIELPRVRLN